jgi:hypothetical protein
MLLIYRVNLSRRTTISSVQIAPWLAPAVTAVTLVSTVYLSIPTRFAFILVGIIVAATYYCCGLAVIGPASSCY